MLEVCSTTIVHQRNERNNDRVGIVFLHYVPQARLWGLETFDCQMKH